MKIRGSVVSLTPLQLEILIGDNIAWNSYREGFGGSKGVKIFIFPRPPEDS